jgi:hypothetical protein
MSNSARWPGPDCAATVRRLIEGDLEGWDGLPREGCGHDQISSVLEGGSEEGTGRLSGLLLSFRIYQSPLQTRPIEAWFAAGGSVVLLTFEEPTLRQGPAALLDSLGTPEATLAGPNSPHPDSRQWVYASRGLTVFVREPNKDIVRIAAYPPVSVSYYERYLGAHDTREYLPRPDGL